MKKKILLVIAVLVVCMLAMGCGGDSKGTKQAGKVLKVGTNPDFAPFEFQEKDKKEFVGFDMDLIRAMGKQAGYEVQISSMSFDGLLPALVSKNIDVAISGMTITPARAEKVLFTDPYYKSGLSIVVKQDNNAIKSLKDLEGKKIAVQIGTSSAMATKKVANAQVREFNTVIELFLELRNGGVDAAINDLPVNQNYIKTAPNNGLKITGELLSAEDYGVAISKDNKEVHQKLNAALAELKKNGEYEKIYKKWFGDTVTK